MAVNLSLLLRQFDELWCLWVIWLAGSDITCWNPIDFLSYRIIPVAWDIESVVMWFESHSGAGNHDEGRLIFQGVYPVPSMFDYWLFSALFWVVRQYVSRLICCSNYFASFDKSRTLFCRHFFGIFSLVIWKPRDSWEYFQEFVIAIARIAFSNGATNCNKNFLFHRFFIVCV